jgi:hypothetical protein
MMISSPYAIYEYADDTIQLPRSNSWISPRQNSEIIDVIDIGPQDDDFDLPDLINQSERPASINGNIQDDDTDDDMPDLVPQRHDNDSSFEHSYRSLFK